MEIRAKDIKRLLLRTYKRYQEGSITADQAHKESQLLYSITKAIEVTDLEERLAEIETAVKHINHE